ncbi:hypothetical protein BJV78DRAFT_1244372 [Lactifluus subvellereus]|nr:hypothetical protein BJV78DRAFT_1244372 [Lactifluus subvellereus]
MHLLPFLATLVIIRGETNGRHHLRPTRYPKPLPKVLFIMDQWHLRAFPTLTCPRLTVLLFCHAAIGDFWLLMRGIRTSVLNLAHPPLH